MNGDAEWHLPQIPNGPPAESTITRQAERIRALESERDKFAEGSAEAMKKHLEQFTRAETAEAKVRELEGLYKDAVDNRNYYADERKKAQTQLTAANSREERLLEIVDLARELVSPAGMVNRGVDRGLVVVESADLSDPHYRLCEALEDLDRAALQSGKVGT